MKFDIDRAMTWVQVFAFLRTTGSEGERHAADLLAERLEQAGWRVSRAKSRTCCRLLSFVMLLLLLFLLNLYFLWKALQLSFPTLSTLVRSGWFIVGLLLIGGLLSLAAGYRGVQIARERFVAWWAVKEHRSRVNLIADRPGQKDQAARVFILSHLDTPLPVAKTEDALSNAIVIGLLVAIVVLPLSRALNEWLLVGITTVTLLFQVRYWLRSGHPSVADNRTGLALLAELSEALPPRLLERVDVRLVAVCGSSAGQLGAVTLADDVGHHWPNKPTLVINLDSPGLGPEIHLIGQGRGLEVARAAAKDLWIPHRVSRWSMAALDHRPFQFHRIPAVSLTGRANGTQIESAGLAAAAQLTTEMALRWARPETQRGQGASLPRSSQNPG